MQQRSENIIQLALIFFIISIILIILFIYTGPSQKRDEWYWFDMAQHFSNVSECFFVCVFLQLYVPL